MSRELYPKQFLKFSGSSLFQDTLRRCLKVSDISEIFVVTSEKQKFFVYGQIKELELDLHKENILLEPEGKNTLPAISFAIREIERKYGSSTVGVFSSDHILDIDAMEIIAGAKKLTDGHLVTFGIVPESPHTGYGYVKPGRALDVGYEVSEFKEKPDSDDARRYVGNGYLWNSGMFLFSTELFIRELQLHAQQLWEEFFNSNRDINDIYHNIPSISIDYGLMEKSDHVAVVKLVHKWSDLGNFDALYDENENDEQGNVVYDCDDVLIDSTDNLIYSKPDKVVSLIDVHDMVVVDTPDALLVCPLKSSQRVKDVVTALKDVNDERACLQQTVYRPWGSYTILEASEGHKIKNIMVMPKKSLSLQMHHHRSEHWVVVKGMACVQVNGKQQFLRQGESTFIRSGEKHRLSNHGKIPLEIIEVQMGECVDEDDIVRFDDEYGRA